MPASSLIRVCTARRARSLLVITSTASSPAIVPMISVHPAASMARPSPHVRSSGWPHGVGFSWGQNLAVNHSSGDDGEQGGGGRWKAVEDGGGEHREVRLLPNLERADLLLESERPGAFERQHSQRVRSLEPGGRGLGQYTRVPHAHHRIGAEADAQAGPPEGREWGGAVAVRAVRAWTMSQPHPCLPQRIDVPLVYLDAMDAQPPRCTL